MKFKSAAKDSYKTKKYKYILFDLDGTLTDTYEGITECFKYALSHFEKEADQSRIRDIIGPPILDSFCKFYGFDDEKGKAAVKIYRERYDRVGWRENKLFEGIPKVLEMLKKSGRHIAVATSKPQIFAERILKYHNIDKYFDVISGASVEGNFGTKLDVITESVELLGNPDKSEILMIGDRRYDIEGAKAFGIDSLGVLFGFAEDGELEAFGADYTVKTVNDLYDFLIVH